MYLVALRFLLLKCAYGGTESPQKAQDPDPPPGPTSPVTSNSKWECEVAPLPTPNAPQPLVPGSVLRKTRLPGDAIKLGHGHGRLTHPCTLCTQFRHCSTHKRHVPHSHSAPAARSSSCVAHSLRRGWRRRHRTVGPVEDSLHSSSTHSQLTKPKRVPRSESTNVLIGSPKMFARKARLKAPCATTKVVVPGGVVSRRWAHSDAVRSHRRGNGACPVGNEKSAGIVFHAL